MPLAVGGTDNDARETRNHGAISVIVAESYLLITPITLANLSR